MSGKVVLLSVFLSLAATLSQAAPLQAFTAHYDADFDVGPGLSAKTVRRLSQQPDGHWQLQQKAENFLASINETSDFQWHTPKLLSQRYEYLRKVLGKKRHALLSFNWQQQQVTNDVQDQTWSYAIKPGTLDKLNYQLQLRLDLRNGKTEQLNYEVADGGVLKVYRFKIIGEETLDTDMGKLLTLKVERLYDQDEKKQSFLWFAKKLDYLMVKYSQTSAKGKHSQLLITSIED